MPDFRKLTSGNPRLPPLIFLHGFFGCKEDWEQMIPFFENSYYCIALDLPGHGSTPYCDDILLALKAEIPKLTSSKPVLIGYSMGGRIAMQLREFAKALVNISGHPGLHSHKEREERLQSDTIWSEKLLTLPLEAFFSQWYSQPVFHPLATNLPSMQSLVKRRMKQNSADLARVMLQMSLARQTPIVDFPCPTLFLHGENDLKYRDIFSRLSSTVTVREVDSCGHAALVENAAGCSKLIANWLGEIDANA